MRTVTSGQVGDIKYFIQAKNKGVKAIIDAPDETHQMKLSSWERAEQWITKEINRIKTNEINRTDRRIH